MTNSTPTTSSIGTPGRRSPDTIIEAVIRARKAIKPFADAHSVHVTSVFRWKDRSAVQVLKVKIKKVADKFGVHPETLIDWVNTTKLPSNVG